MAAVLAFAWKVSVQERHTWRCADLLSRMCILFNCDSLGQKISLQCVYFELFIFVLMKDIGLVVLLSRYFTTESCHNRLVVLLSSYFTTESHHNRLVVLLSRYFTTESCHNRLVVLLSSYFTTESYHI
jgi:hypothetical protein